MDPESLQRRRATRAHERRQRVVRRRIAALAALAGVAVIAVVVVASSGGSTATSSGGAAVASGNGADAHKHLHAAHHRARAATYPKRGASTASVLGPATGKPGTTSVPILMYHVINAPPRGRAVPGPVRAAPHEFAAQMQALKAAGWHAVTLDQLRAYWTHGAPLPAGKPIVLTFDNGYHSQYTAALPVLKQARLGRRREHPAHRPAALPGRADERRGPGLVAAGWELDTQGISHADLVALDPVRAPLPGRHRPRDHPAPVRRPGQLVLLSVGPLQRDRDRGRQVGRLHRLDDGDPGLGEPVQRSVPAAAAARARRHQPVRAALADRLDRSDAAPPSSYRAPERR